MAWCFVNLLFSDCILQWYNYGGFPAFQEQSHKEQSICPEKSRNHRHAAQLGGTHAGTKTTHLSFFLFFFLLFLFLILFILLGAEGAIRQAVDSDDLLVGVLEDEVLALLQLHADVNDTA
ncbi:hypothetical protein U0070_013240 [Myodes glareolus]|uniref:Uncharacterized protein n=1 Tax=Myodes glareolus TaxID=447135 RepID=A0AAW0I4G6_MYOGA